MTVTGLRTLLSLGFAHTLGFFQPHLDLEDNLQVIQFYLVMTQKLHCRIALVKSSDCITCVGATGIDQTGRVSSASCLQLHCPVTLGAQTKRKPQAKG